MNAWFDFAWKFFVAVGAIAFTAGTLYFQWKRGKNSAGMAAAAEWEKLAGARKAEIERLEGEVKDLVAALQRKTDEHEKTQREHNECQQQVLRLLARIQRHERVINNLERQAGLAVTDFDDPTHRSELPERRQQ